MTIEAGAATMRIMGSAPEELRKFLLSLNPVVYIVTWEENRAERLIAEVAAKSFKNKVPVYTWSAAKGITDESGKVVNESWSASDALAWTASHGETAYHVYKDLHKWWENPQTVSKVREIYKQFSGTYKRLILISPTVRLPLELEKEVKIFELGLPGAREMESVFEAAKAMYEKMHKKQLQPEENIKGRMINAAMGLTTDEARSAFFSGMKRTLDESSVEAVLAEKQQLIRKSGVLDYVRHNYGIDDVGGLTNLKEWLRKRSAVLSPNAAEAGLSPPKGVLMTGIAGCGKSMCVQAIASYWKLPLIRLDLNKVYAGIFNNPEETLERALRVAEAMAPCVLWIDEIEKGVSRSPAGSAIGPTARIFSRFLTWMQEKEGLVFIAATANEIDLLAPEFLRKGRFDEIFFIDLPTEEERAQIFHVHLKRRNQNVENFNLVNLAKAARDFSGSEIEQAVVSGLFEAYDQGRSLQEKDIYSAVGRTIPLATTMAEDIKKIKRWALDRAVKASG